jgi:hypothetical protein
MRASNKINFFHQDNFTVDFSNFPEIFEDPNKSVDLDLLNKYVKNIVVPDMTLDTLAIEFLTKVEHQPISKANNELAQMTIEFKLDENLRNYYYLLTYIKQMRYGSGVDYSRHNAINAISINTLDNQRRQLGKIEFTKALPMSIGSLSLMSGDSEDASFAVSFQYEEFRLALFNENGELEYEN